MQITVRILLLRIEARPRVYGGYCIALELPEQNVARPKKVVAHFSDSIPVEAVLVKDETLL